ncbi:hypothetical protein C8J57DRAFT_13501 [Mycena rebaudengoi]|nr:hypothetical protein C8J57DRAFT_13501 [Mycena rebaudengoi]
MDIDATSPVASSQIPQKRVLPSRLRRGGPGVGNCEVDVMILNIQMNKSMEAPLIPTESPFFMTTDGSLEEIAREFSPAPTVNPPVHSERPEVMEAYRQKAVIETPEYQDVSDVPTTDGRLRTRLPAPTDDKTIILSDSDAVYEKRHKKYETFEKRQRLREKEKLKHEQYKLKERIEQLRAMDNSAFLAAPASSFSPRPQLVEDDGEDIGAPSSHPNGASAYNEGERRRKEMLLNAQTLEERYRILLPPERPHQRRPAGQSSLNVSTDPESELVAKDYPLQEDGESELDEGFTAQREIPKIRLPATLIPRTTSTSSKKRRRSSIPPPALPSLHRSPAAPRRARAGPSLIGDTSPALLGPSLLQAQSSPGSSGLSSGVDVVSGFRHMRYETDSQPGKVVKQARQRGGRPGQPARKKAKTEEGGLPSSHDHSVPSGQSFDDDQIPHKRSSSPHQHESYSFPPPPPPPESWQPFQNRFHHPHLVELHPIPSYLLFLSPKSPTPVLLLLIEKHLFHR